jgi:hypothetical protein
MAAEASNASADKTIEKAVWHYVGVGILWLSLFLTGVAFERLGLTSSILSGVLPGETGSLQTQVAECQNNLRNANQERDLMMRSKQALEVEVGRLKKAAAQTPPAP